MRIFPVLVIPIHRIQTDPGVGCCANQIRFFDAYYTHPLIVGVHVVGAPLEECAVIGVSVRDDVPECGVSGLSVARDEEETKLVAGYIVEDSTGECGVAGFSVSNEQEDCGPRGFSAQDEPPPCQTVGMSTTKEPEEECDIIGFTVEDKPT